ncbi:MAG: GLPGLI family protein [Winogradskyella sp.]|uniref:GLPGLI family protein n=1 Tax=Winogradskyella sp. TaxID=1883156 RepID=UPI00179FCB96|nr:GLPGLI family protein [Winogradskyella sp.]MBT8243620.1 GLPGLI family protein [Winogradskyella sp.]NNK23854.1 GLPGLI family protein [Winogradskyella sp.]
MKLSQLNVLAFAILLAFSGFSFGQAFQAKAYYQTKTTIDMSQFGGGRQISPDQMKRMQERMKSFLEKQYTLVFNKEESIYKEEEKLEAQAGGGRGWVSSFSSSFTGGPKYKNVKEKLILQDQEFFGKKFLIKDELKSLEWKMSGETKQIGQYTAFNATATKPVTGFDWRNMRRRGNDNKKKNDSISAKKSDNPTDEIEMPKTIEVIAWYTPQIPINQGPDDYWGLPGLILEVNADRTTILCTKIIINPKEKDVIDKPEKGEVVTQEEYTKITTEKMEEMRSNWRGRRGRGRN